MIGARFADRSWWSKKIGLWAAWFGAGFITGQWSVSIPLPALNTNKEKAMLVTITRTHKSSDGIFGNLAIEASAYKCLTLENLALCIPPGVYGMRYRWSPDFQQIMPTIEVPNRTDIMLHWANWPKQLLGCVALGTEEDFKEDMIEESKKSWIGFAEAVSEEPAVTIKIVEDYGPVASV